MGAKPPVVAESAELEAKLVAMIKQSHDLAQANARELATTRAKIDEQDRVIRSLEDRLRAFERERSRAGSPRPL